eukprot:XP_011603485.1 PREDICTED: thyroglobulin [Takifugu rubripes]
MAWLLHITWVLVCWPELLQGRSSAFPSLQYECNVLLYHAPDGVCTGVSPCQLQSLLKCSPSGLFEEVQCDHSRGQCWCVDQNGMELYGTRQNGRPSRCPGSCEVRSRSLLHSSTPHTPPQCDGSGSFLPVQCVFINTTTGTQLDMMTVFNSFPEAFETFSGFRKLFPTVSSYCFCSDSRGREMHNTGVELLLSDVYDSAFDAHPPVRSFAQSNIYRVLQRRMLAVRLRITGRFRCPSPCEEERWAATEAHSVYIPSCEPGGAFTTRQCQQGGQCWCVDHTGQELPGTRQQALLDCKLGPDSCPARRHRALFHLLSGSVAVPLQTSISDRSQTSCNSLLQTLRDLLPVEVEFPPFLSQLVEVVDGLFRTVGGALRALSHSSPQRLNENLFGGKFLKEIASSNISGVLGSQGTFVRDWVSGKGDSLQENRVLVESVRRVLGDPAFLSSLKVALQGHSSLLPPEQILTPLLRSCSGQDVTKHATFLPRCTPSGAFQEIQCDSGECWCVDSQGHEVLGSRTAGRPSRCPSICERQQWSALNMRKNMAAGAEIYVPVCSEDGDFLPLQCVGSHCFCVDAKGNNVSPAGGAVSCPESLSQTSSTGSCSGALAKVTAFRNEVKSILNLSNSSIHPLEYEFLLADISPLTLDEINQTEEGQWITDRLLSHSRSALRLAAFSLVHRRSYEPFLPQCDGDGNWLNRQCFHSTGQCWCVDEDGEYIPDSLTSRSDHLPRCLTQCQRAHAQLLLSGWMKSSDHSRSYSPQCEEDGKFSVLQTGGDAGWCVNPQNGEQIQMATLSPGGQLTCPSRCQLLAFQCKSDGSFQPLQCDMNSCWCVSEDGQEVSGTRTRRQLGQLPASGRSVSLCDASSVHLQCDNGITDLMLMVTWSAKVSDLATSDLPNLQDFSQFLNDSSLLRGIRDIMGNIQSMLASKPKLVSVKSPSLGCSRGYRLDLSGAGCLICPAGTLSTEGGCALCPQGTYQDQEGRDFCHKCPRGSSLTGASSVNQCVTDCQSRGLRCSEKGDFLPAQPDFLSGRWRCVSSEGLDLDWSNSEKALTDEECSVFRRFQAVSGSDVIVNADDAEVLRTLTADLSTCLHACSAEPSCHHVALFNLHSQCELYSTHTVNTHCNTSQQTRGFLGNLQAEHSDWLSCFPRVKGRASDLLVIKKKGVEFTSSWQQQQMYLKMKMMKVLSGVFRTQVFSSRQTSLSDVHRFCQDTCHHDKCCHGYIINQNSLMSGSLFCGWLRSPSVLMCEEQDWDVTGQGTANRICGAGLQYNEQQKSFVFDFGGQMFTITDTALSTDTKTKKDYQASIISFQAVFLNPDADEGRPASSCSGTADLSPPLDASLKQRFQLVSENDVIVNPNRKLPTLSFWLNKKHFDSQHALLWCLSRCDEEPQCSVADLRDADSAQFHSCSLYPDSRECGGYENPRRQSCALVLETPPDNTYSKTVNLSGPIKSFFERIPFQKMVSYSVRSRTRVTGNTSLSEGFIHCERRCDEDPCCRGFGFIRDNKSMSNHDVLCLSLISFGVQTCSEEDSSSWRTQDCSTSVQTGPEPLGWYQKPVNQWSSAPALCPEFTLKTPANMVSQDQWQVLSNSMVLVDRSLSTYDVIHISRDIATNPDETRDFCLLACQKEESCVAVTLMQVASATRCILYPDTTICGLSSTRLSSNPTSSCRLLIREPASHVYLRTEPSRLVTSISIPGHGTLQGAVTETGLGSVRKSVVQFLGVPYARPPIGSLRFEAAQLADWTGTWDATKPRPSCIQPGDSETAASSEDCLYLNIFTPAQRRGHVPVLVFFTNLGAYQSSQMLDGSILAAVGNIVVVTASYRVAAFGFLSTGFSGLHGNYGLSDQEAVLHWVNAHISLVGGDNERVTVGAEQRGADITSLHLLSSSPRFQRMLLMGGSVFSPSLLQTPPSSRREALQLATELGCFDNLNDMEMAACLRAIPAHELNIAQTKLLAVSGPFQSWSPVHQPTNTSSFQRVDLLIGTSQHDSLITRARRLKDLGDLLGHADGKTAFYEALSRSLGSVTGSEQLKEVAVWFYSLDHSPTASGYNLFSRALDNATRDLFIICPSLRMVSHWAKHKASAFLYHQPLSSAHSRAETSVPLDVQLMFGSPYHPINIQRFTRSDRRLSLATMTYFSTFVRTGNPNPSHLWAESVLPQWPQVVSSDTPLTYLELSPTLKHNEGLSQRSCSFWNHLASRLTSTSSVSGETVLQAVIPELPLAMSSSQSQTDKDAYN